MVCERFPACLHIPQASREGSSDSEEDEAEKRHKSREERKTEAVWKMFEKMEASAQRKRQSLMSEGDCDALPSPTTLHPPHLSRQSSSRRTSSSSSRKAHLLPRGKL